LVIDIIKLEEVNTYMSNKNNTDGTGIEGRGFLILTVGVILCVVLSIYYFIFM
jgi:hypothetical protein